ncbi:MAG: hypothetical protein LBR26_16175, partial [Prevotella sp.]|nr:hypothetical protein [Prevotella sp.]
DICRYLTQTGDAPGSLTGTRWRMPTAAEFASPTTASPAIPATTDYALAGTFLSSGSLTTGTDATGKWKVTYSSTFPGRRKQYSHIWTAGSAASQLATADQPFFPAGGDRIYDTGQLRTVGSQGWYWSSSPYNNATNSYPLIFYSNSVTVPGSGARADGDPVRCVKE